MSTTRRFQWLKYLFCLTLLIGVFGRPAFAAQDNAETGTSIVETLFWLCLLDDHKPTTTQSASQCCDGDGCYTCLSDFSECWISSDTSATHSSGLQSQRPNIRPMQDSPSESQLRNVCNSVKATFTSLADYGYTCLKTNCNGKGGYCSITCHDDRSCSARTPDVLIHAVSLRGILQNGDNVDHSGSGGTESVGGGSENEGNPCGPDGCLY